MSVPRIRLLRAAALAAVVGTCFQFGGCGLGDLLTYVGNFNPCGSILACDPVTYNFVRSGYEGPGADPDVDPSCTYPPYCPDDPFVYTILPTGQ